MKKSQIYMTTYPLEALDELTENLLSIKSDAEKEGYEITSIQTNTVTDNNIAKVVVTILFQKERKEEIYMNE